MTKSNNLPADQYVAVIGYNNGVPIFSDPVYASDQVAAKIMFDVSNIKYFNVMLYVNNDNLIDDE